MSVSYSVLNDTLLTMEGFRLKQFIKYFISIHLIAQCFGLSCNLRLFNADWLNDWRLFLEDHGNSQYELLRSQNVAANNRILALCNNERTPHTVTCNNNQMFSEPLPLRESCTETESLAPVRIEAKVPYCRYTLYRIGFNIRIGGRHEQFVETYQVCFDREHMRPLFTINKAYPMAGKRPEFLQFNPDDIFYGQTFSAFSRKASFRRFNNLLGPSQPYMKESNVDHIIDRGHLTPSADFSLTNLKRATFNMINVMPQFKTIDNGNWKRIEEWARHPSRTPAHICTGVFDCDLDSENIADLDCVVQLEDARGRPVPMFLADKRKVPIPLWLYKIVKSNKNALVFLTLNNIYHRGNVAVPQHMCQKLECPIELIQTVASGRTFCCEYNHFISKNVPHLKDVC